jgi:SAM-dependent methyltransferase
VAVKADREIAATPAPSLDTVIEIAACPDCYSSLELRGSGLRCTKCGREFETRSGIPILLPSSADATGTRYLANYEAMATDDLAKPFEGNRPARHQKLKEFIGSVANKRVLDIGSSDATYLRQMDADVKVALDIAIEYLVKIPAESRVIGICGDAEQLPIKAGYFDVVIISDVLEHVLHPERVAEHLLRISRPDTRLIVHVPWEEDLSQYRDVPYEFTHLRTFDAFTFGTLFKHFYERRSRGTYPLLTAPLPYRLYGILPRPLYNSSNILTQWTGFGAFMNRKWVQWIDELPQREWWLLLFYRPIFRQFELRTLRGTLRYRFAVWLRSKLKRQHK